MKIVHTAPWPHYPNKNVFSHRRNWLYGKSASFRCDGRLFHSTGLQRLCRQNCYLVCQRGVERHWSWLSHLQHGHSDDPAFVPTWVRMCCDLWEVDLNDVVSSSNTPVFFYALFYVLILSLDSFITKYTWNHTCKKRFFNVFYRSFENMFFNVFYCRVFVVVKT